MDNVKMTLVTVVVMGHTLPLFSGGGGLQAQLYDFIYVWHIPAFVLVTGYFSRSFQWSRRHLWALLTTIALPYLVFEAAMLGWRLWLGDIDAWPEDAWLNPHWPMWYLVAVFCWRLATPVLTAHWLMVPLAVAVALVHPELGGDTRALNRVVQLLPFFVIGLHLRPAWVALLRTRAAAVAGAVGLGAVWVAAGWTDSWIATKWLWHAFDYDYFGVSLAEGSLKRLGVIALALVGTLAVIAVVPRRRTWFTDLGAATLVVYLFHGFVIKGAGRLLEGTPVTGEYAAWALWPALAVAVGVAVLLAWRPVSSRLNWAVDPVGSVQRAVAERRARDDDRTRTPA
jgi:fucose 4-O-acetylase-like acetyltransferase